MARRLASGNFRNNWKAASDRRAISRASAREVSGRSQMTLFVEGDMVLMVDAFVADGDVGIGSSGDGRRRDDEAIFSGNHRRPSSS
jgi:hypothetical protein